MLEPSEPDEPSNSGIIQALFRSILANSSNCFEIQANARMPEFQHSGSLNPRILEIWKACRAASSVAM